MKTHTGKMTRAARIAMGRAIAAKRRYRPPAALGLGDGLAELLDDPAPAPAAGAGACSCPAGWCSGHEGCRRHKSPWS